jgi:hypothetical protein
VHAIQLPPIKSAELAQDARMPISDVSRPVIVGVRHRIADGYHRCQFGLRLLVLVVSMQGVGV